MVRLFQINQTKPLQKHFRSLLSKEQLSIVSELNQEMDEKEKESVKQISYFMQDKKTIHILVQLFQFRNPEGEPLGRLLVVEDLTELDRSIRARAWREVARRIAHEIKNPLTPIQLSAQRIRKKYIQEENKGEMLDTCTETIIREVDSLKTMVNEFSQFARIPEIRTEPANLNKLLEEVYNLFKTGISKNIDLKIQLDSKVPKAIALDPEPIKRVFTNLIDNAIAAIENKGEILITSSFAQDLKLVVISIEDTGSGIPEQMMDRIFDPYVTTKKEGTGLGFTDRAANYFRSQRLYSSWVRINQKEPFSQLNSLCET